MNASQTFADAAALVPYLDALGVSDLYLSPVFRARPGSPHGYDVVDHATLSPELGGREGFEGLAGALRERAMGIVLDVVPNHMDITTADNTWWMDVLENGPSSPYSDHFDIDWDPPKPDLADKVLLPVLADQYGRVIEEQGVRLAREGGAFRVECAGRQLPVAPKSLPIILSPACDALTDSLGEEDPSVLELASIITAIRNLPGRSERDPERVRERQREKEIVKGRLASLLEASPEAQAAVAASVDRINGRPGVPTSFDALEGLLADQAYRLSHWRVASDEINYRRFFDINELAAIRVERQDVFEAVHALPLSLFESGAVTGLRIDHVDGLYDPRQILGRLPQGLYVVVEKILEGHERLAGDWPVHGTTGYDFLRMLNGLFVDSHARRALRELYRRQTGRDPDFAQEAYVCKKLTLSVAMVSELTVLSRRLDRISEQHRYSRDFTLNSLQAALAEIIACFPVYRTYQRPDEETLTAEDRRHITIAVAQARQRNPAVSASVFDFIASVLLREDPEGLDAAQRAERRDFVQRFQQLTGPVMAKGVEDTAFYRHVALVSLNEVGGDPEHFGVSSERFHVFCSARAREWPLSLSASSTHDTKRAEDVRARINVLSEVVPEWRRAILRWTRINAPHRRLVDGRDAPDPNDEYLLYQTLVGTWPLGGPASWEREGYVERVSAYMRKALREAKLHTSWVSPNPSYEEAVEGFVQGVLTDERGAAFRQDFEGFLAPLVRPGLLNGIAQAVVKGCAPGVPDIYQGAELWDFSLVDPDNRRPVDFELRRGILGTLDREAEVDVAALCDRLLASLEDGQLKLYATSRILRLRRQRPQLFSRGRHQGLRPAGPRRGNVVSFARRLGREVLVVAVARFFASLPAPTEALAWQATSLRLPAGLTGTWRDVLSGRRHQPVETGRASLLALADVFSHLPVAVLELERP